MCYNVEQKLFQSDAQKYLHKGLESGFHEYRQREDCCAVSTESLVNVTALKTLL
jgi:hypothetical protein